MGNGGIDRPTLGRASLNDKRPGEGGTRTLVDWHYTVWEMCVKVCSKLMCRQAQYIVPQVGVEPTTSALGVPCSIQFELPGRVQSLHQNLSSVSY